MAQSNGDGDVAGDHMWIEAVVCSLFTTWATFFISTIRFPEILILKVTLH